MEHVKNITSSRLTRFLIVGAANTTVNFVVLNFAFHNLHRGKLLSSIIATSCAVIFSFIFNRGFVFIDKKRPVKKLLRFILVSVVGVLIIQTSAYALSIAVLNGHISTINDGFHSWLRFRLSNTLLEINLSNLIASFVVMFWNYNGYRIFVFTNKECLSESEADLGPKTA